MHTVDAPYLLRLASVAYEDLVVLCSDESRRRCTQEFQLHDATNISQSKWDVDAFIAKRRRNWLDSGDGHDMVVVVRGTESWRDLQADLKVCKSGKADTSCLTRVHCGFLAQAASLLESIDAAIRRSVADNGSTAAAPLRVWLTGHSLGGAVVTLLAYMLRELKDPYGEEMCTQLNVCTFGSPRVGNYFFKEAYAKLEGVTTTRYCTDTDIITCMPCMNYWHVGERKILPIPKDPEGCGISTPSYPNFHAHKLTSYTSALKAATDRRKH